MTSMFTYHCHLFQDRMGNSNEALRLLFAAAEKSLKEYVETVVVSNSKT